MMKKIFLSIVSVLLLFVFLQDDTVVVTAVTHHGVDKVIDGDTFVFNNEKIRVVGIDAPEMGFGNSNKEHFADAATQAVSELFQQYSFTLEKQGSENRGYYGRLLRSVVFDDLNKSLEMILVEQGLARVYFVNSLPRDYRESLCAAQVIAQAEEIGIWNAKDYEYFEAKKHRCPSL